MMKRPANVLGAGAIGAILYALVVEQLELHSIAFNFLLNVRSFSNDLWTWAFTKAGLEINPNPDAISAYAFLLVSALVGVFLAQDSGEEPAGR